MAIIEVAPGQSQGTKGIEKKIDKSSEKMIFNILQSTMYSHPLESAVREISTNMVDALEEKRIAKCIIVSNEPVENYFISRDKDEYKDSVFKRNYYDTQWLSDENKAVITYTENNGVGFCDKVEFYDTGVGLSPERFIKAIGLAYSSKRNSSKLRGGYGVGLKSPLATDVEYFTVESCWNGKRIIANCYKYKSDFLISKLNLTTGNLNNEERIDLGEDTYVLYSEPTLEKNYTKITFGVKKINRGKFKDAVTTQLMYLSNIDFNYIDDTGDKEMIDIKPVILYNSSNIILTDNNYYEKPHIVVVKDYDDKEGICYGLLEFEELELDSKHGSIGIKCCIRSVIQDDDTGEEIVLQEGIQVTPAREKVIFNETTKAYLIKRFKEVTLEAEKIIKSELVETDLLEWLKKCSEVMASTNGNTVLHRLSWLIDVNAARPKFNENIQYGYNPEYFFEGFLVRTNIKRYDTKENKYVIDRDTLSTWNDFKLDNVYIQTENTNRYRDLYLASIHSSFLTIQIINDDKYIDKLNEASKEPLKKSKIEKILKLKQSIEIELKSSIHIKDYDSVVVPDNFNVEIDQKEAEEDGGTGIKQLSREELRKIEQKTILHYPRKNYTDDLENYEFTFQAAEMQIKEFMGLDNVFYGSTEQTPLLQLASLILTNKFEVSVHVNRLFNFDELKIIKVSEVVGKKYCKKHKPIKNLFYDLNLKNMSLITTPHIKNWYTARMMKDKMKSFLFLNGFKYINGDIHTIYIEVKDFYNSYYLETDEIAFNRATYNDSFKEVISYLDKMKDLQFHCIDNSEVGTKAFELFGIDAIKNASVVELEMWEKFQNLCLYTENIQEFFNNLEFLTKAGSISQNNIKIIKELLVLKKLDDFKISKDYQVVTTETGQEVVQDENKELVTN